MQMSKGPLLKRVVWPYCLGCNRVQKVPGGPFIRTLFKQAQRLAILAQSNTACPECSAKAQKKAA